MTGRLPFLWPEIVLFITTCVVMVIGLSPRYAVRKSSAWVAGLGLILAGLAAAFLTPTGTQIAPGIDGPAYAVGQTILPNLVPFAKGLTAIVGLLALLILAGTVDRDEERRVALGAPFDPLRSNRAEFYSFFLFSLTGLMLVASADNLIWLFLALELTSLPTYIMVTISSHRHRSQEAGVKYFFLGALGAAVFLYGFALLYGATGTTNLNAISHELAVQLAQGGLSPLAAAGLLLSILGLCFKIAAVPMHFYTADVYQGASSGVAGFLAFVPKTAGFLAIILLCGAVLEARTPALALRADAPPGELARLVLPESLRLALWVIAALTMTVGNVLALQQSSLKRMLAYSSIAHSGYMLVGVIAGPGDGSFWQNGYAAVLFYLLAYGVTNLGAFGVLACLERPGRTEDLTSEEGPQEIESFEDIRGLCHTRPLLGWTLVLCSLSLLGFPPLLGFIAKLPLFTSAINAGEIPLVIVLGVNSAIAAYYYLRIAGAAYLEPGTGDGRIRDVEFLSRPVAAALSAGGVILLSVVGVVLTRNAEDAANFRMMHKPAAAVLTPAPSFGDILPSVPGADRLRTVTPGTVSGN